MDNNPKILAFTVRQALLMIVRGIEQHYNIKSYLLKMDRLDPGEVVLLNGKEALVHQYEDGVLTVEE